MTRDKRFTSPKELRNCLIAKCSHLICDSKDDFFVSFNKGQRGGGKVWITDAEDLDQLYSVHSKDPEIVLWCEGKRSQKQKQDNNGIISRPSKRQAIQEEVEEVFLEL